MIGSKILFESGSLQEDVSSVDFNIRLNCRRHAVYYKANAFRFSFKTHNNPLQEDIQSSAKRWQLQVFFYPLNLFFYRITAIKYIDPGI